MLTIMSQKMSSFFIYNGIIKEEDKDVYNYSFEILLSTVLNSIGIIVMALLTGRIIETVMYLAAFIPLRSLAGGYHAKTHLRCFLILIGTFALFLIMISTLPVEYYIIFNIAAALLSVILVFFLSPVGDANKPLTDEETSKFKNQSRIAILVYFDIILLFTYLLHGSVYILSIACGVITVALSLAAAKIRNTLTDVINSECC